MPAPVQARACTQMRRLLRAFTKAVSDLNRIHSAELRALMNGEDVHFQDEFAEASARKEGAKHAVLAHRQKHGC